MTDKAQIQRQAFNNYLQNKKKQDGSNYSENTIKAYIMSLSSDPAKLVDVSLVSSNLYEINSSILFAQEREKIINAKNFKQILEKARNQAFKQALGHYGDFLLQQENGHAVPTDQFAWTKFYEETANRILEYRENRTKLLEILHGILGRLEMNDSLYEKGNIPLTDICPFTVIGLFTKSIKIENRIKIATELAKELKIDVPVPTSFDGIPVLNPLKSWFFGYSDKRAEDDIDNLWELFAQAIKLVDVHNYFETDHIQDFQEIYNKVAQQYCVKWNITCGLYWINPWVFIPLDRNTREYLQNQLHIAFVYSKPPMSSAYIDLISTMQNNFLNQDYPVHNFIELSYNAWLDEKVDPIIETGLSLKEYKAMDKNIILYGPPGTGKTYNTVAYAVAIIEDTSPEEIQSEIESAGYGVVLDRYRKYKTDGQIAFTTFHQSYGYEEFIEGIKPVMDGESAEDEGENHLSYELKAGSFKAFCETAKSPIIKENNQMSIGKDPTIWKMSLWGARENSVKRDCFTHGRVRIGWDEYDMDISKETKYEYGGKSIIASFMNEMLVGDIILTLYDSNTIDGIGVIVGEYEVLDDVDKFRRSRKVKWLVKDVKENIMQYNDNTVLSQKTLYRLGRITLKDVLDILKKHVPISNTEIQENTKNYVFIIDEINRGNISKIFGELITLIETSKRIGGKEEMWAKLPYSQVEFGVPSNVYILGTMNTADRSISMIDTALRRRFHFEEMMPDPDVLKDIDVEGISISAMLAKMNQRIEVLYDREHTIGHAYFIDLKDDPTMEMLSCIFKNAIIPLLQEYFFEDYQKIQLVLGDNSKEEKLQFIHTKQIDIIDLFGNQIDLDFEDKKVYEINSSAFENSDAYRKIYS